MVICRELQRNIHTLGQNFLIGSVRNYDTVAISVFCLSNLKHYVWILTLGKKCIEDNVNLHEKMYFAIDMLTLRGCHAEVYLGLRIFLVISAGPERGIWPSCCLINSYMDGESVFGDILQVCRQERLSPPSVCPSRLLY